MICLSSHSNQAPHVYCPPGDNARPERSLSAPASSSLTAAAACQSPCSQPAAPLDFRKSTGRVIKLRLAGGSSLPCGGALRDAAEGGGVAAQRSGAGRARHRPTCVFSRLVDVLIAMVALRAPAAPLAPTRPRAPARCCPAAPAPLRPRTPRQQRCRGLLGIGDGDAALAVPPAEEAEAAAAVASKAADDSAQLRSEMEDLKRR